MGSLSKYFDIFALFMCPLCRLFSYNYRSHQVLGVCRQCMLLERVCTTNELYAQSVIFVAVENCVGIRIVFTGTIYCNQLYLF